VSLVNAQAYYGTVAAELAQCGSPENFGYLGCFNNFLAAGQGSTLFSFSPQAYDPNNPSRSFPGWDPGSDYNSTVTPLSCARVCRAFGYRYAAVRDNNCNCGMQLPVAYLATGLSLQPSADCNVQCAGDSSQTCGGGSAAQIYVDPTFIDASSFSLTAAVLDILVSAYRYLGCFDAANGFPTQDPRAKFVVASMTLCLRTCAGFGYPLVYGSPTGSVFALVSPSLNPT
jgi:hypothetical protein